MPSDCTKQANSKSNKPSKLTKLANSNAVAVVVFLLSIALVVFTAKMTKLNTQETSITEIFGVKIHRNPPQAILTDLGVTSWKRSDLTSLFSGPIFFTVLGSCFHFLGKQTGGLL